MDTEVQITRLYKVTYRNGGSVYAAGSSPSDAINIITAEDVTIHSDDIESVVEISDRLYVWRAS